MPPISKRNKSHSAYQRRSLRWLVIGGVVLALVIGIWFVISSQSSSPGQARPISQLSTRDFHSLAFSPSEPDTVFFGHHGGLLVSRNGGKTWQPTTLQNADAMALALPLSDPQVMYAAGHQVFYKSSDGGQTWQSVTTNLPGLDIHGFAADPDQPNRVYAHVVGFGLFGSQDGGTTWTQISSTAPSSIFNLTLGQNAQTLYAAAGQAGLGRSVDGGQTWTKVENVPEAGVIAVAYAPASKRLYVTTSGNVAGLYVSEAGDQTWVSAGLNGNLLAVAVSPHDSNRLIAVNDKGQVYTSQDAGLTWTDK